MKNYGNGDGGELWIIRDDDEKVLASVKVDDEDPVMIERGKPVILRDYGGEAWIRFEIAWNGEEWKEHYDEFRYDVMVPNRKRVKVWYTVRRSRWGEFWEIKPSRDREKEVTPMLPILPRR